MSRRGRVSLVALAILVVYLSGYAAKVAEDNRRLARTLAGTQSNVVNQLARILEQTAAAEDSGLAAQGSVERILTRVEGLDPDLIRRAIEKASERAGRPVAGPRGPAGPPGPPATSAPAPSTTTSTTGRPGGSTSTTRPPATTTTTRPATTTTTTRCLVGVGKLLRLGC